MAFSEIDVTSPTGKQKGKVLDETIRDFKLQVVTNLEQISNYPHSTALVTVSWATTGRPTENLVVGMFGYNLTLSILEYWNGSAWSPLGMASHTHLGSEITTAVANAILAVTATTANNIPTSDVGGNIWIA
jgi:hypothetical protein